jgi:Cu(I)/Ag(I) efflux system membrane fusion protein
MKALKLFIIVISMALVAFGGWYFGKKSSSTATGAASAPGKKIVNYQCAMHPWIKSDQPGNCTICGMKLTPVYEGESGVAVSSDVVSLSPTAVNVINVQTTEAKVQPLRREIQAAGRIESDETRNRVISSYVDGRIDRLFVNYVGAEVEAGQPLAWIYSPLLLSAQREYQALLRQTNFAEGAALMKEHELLVRDAGDRLKRLGITENQLLALGKAENAFETNANTQVIAPMSGTVVSRAVYEGQYVKEGEKLFEIADLSRMWFRFEVYEQDLPWIKPGQEVVVRTPSKPGQEFKGKVIFIDPNVNETSRSARARVELENPLVEINGKKQRELFNGLYATGTITVETAPVLAIPRTAVLRPAGEARVFVDKGGNAYENRVVTLGRHGENLWEVVAGLSEGEKVVSNGNLLLDSQAELNRQAITQIPNEPFNADHAEGVHLTESELKQAQQFFAFASELGSHLAADNLAGYNDAVTHVEHRVQQLHKALGTNSPAIKSITAINESSGLKPAESLDRARKSFIPFSKAVAEFGQAIKAGGNSIEVHVYKCPMYPAPGKAAQWVQLSQPLRNPFYGSEMIDCGSEVNPGKR